jgi:hypothetical protein
VCFFAIATLYIIAKLSTRSMSKRIEKNLGKGAIHELKSM